MKGLSIHQGNQLETWTSYVSLQKNVFSEYFWQVTCQICFIYAEVSSEPYEASKMKLFTKIGNDFELLFIFADYDYYYYEPALVKDSFEGNYEYCEIRGDMTKKYQYVNTSHDYTKISRINK